MYRLLFILIAIISLTSFRVQKAVKKPLPLHTDSSVIAVRHYNAKILKSYAVKPEFQYNDTVPATNWWDRFWAWLWHLLGNNLKAPGLLFIILKYLLIGLGLGAIIFIIFRLMGVDISGIFRKKAASASIGYSETLENIHEIDFDKELEAAIAHHNYRLAVRLLYLKCLKQLNDAGLIKWEINKTNSTYVQELAATDKSDSFSRLTRQFEYIWYGEFLIDAQVFQTINTSFQEFKKQVK